MICRVVELRHKEVINSSSGSRIGYADDIEVDTSTSRVKAIIVFGRPRCFGLFGRGEDVIIPWSEIELIGEDTILVSTSVQNKQKKLTMKKLFG